jgi:hypothetical protein
LSRLGGNFSLQKCNTPTHLLPTEERAGTVWIDEWIAQTIGRKSDDDAIFTLDDG